MQAEYPRLAQRLLALLIDSLTVLLCLCLSLFALIRFGVESPSVKLLTSFIILFCLEPVLVSLTGGTAGHHLLFLRVRRLDSGRNINLFHAIIRFVIKILLGIPGIIVALKSVRHQAIHDLAVGSIVVYELPLDESVLDDPWKPLKKQTYARHVSIFRRISVIFGYWLLTFVTWSLVSYFGVSVECAEAGVCAPEEFQFLQIGALSFIFSLGLVTALGLVGRLFGCRVSLVYADSGIAAVSGNSRHIALMAGSLTLFVAAVSATHMWLRSNNPEYQFRISKFYQHAGLFEEEVAWLTVAAERGHAWAQTELGYSYLYGLGIDKNCDSALKWFKSAAQQEHPMGINNLGHLYESGCGVKQDLEVARKLYQKSAEKGEPRAMASLARMYQLGRGVEVDLGKSVELYKQGAALGDSNAQFGLGVLYQFGEGVEKDLDTAIVLLRLAASDNNAAAMLQLGEIAQQATDRKSHWDDAIYWYRMSAKHGNIKASRHIGEMYDAGSGVEKDLARALPWYEKAAKGGDIIAQQRLGYIYIEGEGVEKNYAKAYEYFAAAAQQDDAYSQWQLGWMYNSGQSVEKDFEKSAYWFRKASARGDPDAKCTLATMYWNGEGVSVDFTMSYVMFSLLAASPDPVPDSCDPNPEEWRDRAARKLSEKQLNMAQMELANWNAETGTRTPPEMPVHIDGEVLYSKAKLLVIEGRLQEAGEIYLECAQAGHGGCMSHLSAMYFSGQGLEKDMQKFTYWAERAHGTGLEYGSGGFAGALALANHFASDNVRDVERARHWLDSASALYDSPEFFADNPLIRGYFRKAIMQTDSKIESLERNSTQ